ncbi:MAG: hypothetical protein ABIS30_08255, partial [Gallionella sp.]
TVPPTDNWLLDFLGVARPSHTSLADSTGLSVTLPKADEPDQPFIERRQRGTVGPDGSRLYNER